MATTGTATPYQAAPLGLWRLVWNLARSGRDLIRACARQLREARWSVRRRGLIARYLSQHASPRLHVGCGKVLLPGWLNADYNVRAPDVVFVDARESLPFADRSFDFVFSEHLVQDLTYPELKRFVAEVRRVLRAEGVFRLAAPDLERIVSVYGAPPGSAADGYLRWAVQNHAEGADAMLPAFAVNHIFEQCRGFICDRATLAHALKVAGFSDVTMVGVGQSREPALRGLERHGHVLGSEAINEFESVVFEARGGSPAARTESDAQIARVLTPMAGATQ